MKFKRIFFFFLENEIGSRGVTRYFLEQEIQIKNFFLIIRGFVLMSVK